MSSDSARELGVRLKAWRQGAGLRIADVAARTGLAISTISKVENGQMSLTYDKLLQLANGLSLDIAELFEEPASGFRQKGAISARRSIGREGDAQHIKAGVYDYWYLNTDLAQKAMTPIMGETRARTLAEFGELIRHPGEEFILVIEGSLAVHTDIYSPAILKAGESLYIDSSMGHAYLVAEGEMCRFLCVCVGDATEATVETIRARMGG